MELGDVYVLNTCNCLPELRQGFVWDQFYVKGTSLRSGSVTHNFFFKILFFLVINILSVTHFAVP